MTTATPASAPAAVHTARVFRRAMAAEWTRLVTIRSTWWCLLAATALMLFIGAAAGASHDGVELAPIWVPAQIAVVPAQFVFLLLVILAVTGEYTTGAIRSSLQWVPRRGILLPARILVPVSFATVCAVVLAGATNLMAWTFLGGPAEVLAGDITASLGKIALVVAFGSTLAAGIGLLLRSTAGALTAIFLLVLALPIALGNTGVRWLIAISDALPGRAIISLLVVDEVELPASTIGWVTAAWTAAVLLVGGWSLLRRDTT